MCRGSCHGIATMAAPCRHCSRALPGVGGATGWLGRHRLVGKTPLAAKHQVGSVFAPVFSSQLWIDIWNIHTCQRHVVQPVQHRGMNHQHAESLVDSHRGSGEVEALVKPRRGDIHSQVGIMVVRQLVHQQLQLDHTESILRRLLTIPWCLHAGHHEIYTNQVYTYINIYIYIMH